jgi:hypothetical protein
MIFDFASIFQNAQLDIFFGCFLYLPPDLIRTCPTKSMLASTLHYTDVVRSNSSSAILRYSDFLVSIPEHALAVRHVSYQAHYLWLSGAFFI